MTLPLAGIRVVAVEQAVSAPLCTRHLADLGADVIKVERPNGGDFARGYDSAAKGQSAYFVWLNQGKRSIVLDLKDPKGLAALDSLLGLADVFIHNVGPTAAASLGLTWDRLHERWPRLIVCAISGYGQDGPRRNHKAYDLLLQAESGLISLTGTADQPAKVGISIVDISAGMYAFASVLACLFDRQRNDSAEGRFVDVSMLECIAEWMMAPTYHQLYGGHAPARAGMRHNMIVPYGLYSTRDGAVNVAVQTPAQWKRFCEDVIDRPDLTADEHFATNEQRVKERAQLESVIESVFGNLTQHEVLRRLDAAGIPAGTLGTVSDLINHPQLLARDRWHNISTPSGEVAALHHPMNISGLQRKAGRVPSLGEDTDQLMKELASG